MLASQRLIRIALDSSLNVLDRVFLGPPDIIVHDAGKNFMAAASQANNDMIHIRTASIPVEAAHSVSIVERYHSPLRRALNIIHMESPDIGFECALQMAVKAINDSVGPDGLVPMLLVFGALPRLRLPTDHPMPSTFKRAVALGKATSTMSKHFASRQVRDALNTRNGPDVTDIQSTPIGAPILVYRPEKDLWDGLFTLLDIQGEDATVLTLKGLTKFCSTVVKPYLAADQPNDTVFPPHTHAPTFDTEHAHATFHQPHSNFIKSHLPQ